LLDSFSPGDNNSESLTLAEAGGTFLKWQTYFSEIENSASFSRRKFVRE
jgi:hypothetical protein